MGDDDLRAQIEELNHSIRLLHGDLNFIMGLERPGLLILIRLAYVLERVANKVFDLPEAGGEPPPGRIEEVFREIRQLFDEQQAMMRGDKGNDG